MKDVTGFTLGEALKLMKDEGAGQIEVKLAAAPRKAGEEYNLLSRVVRQKEAEAGVMELIVCNMQQPD